MDCPFRRFLRLRLESAVSADHARVQDFMYQGPRAQ